MDQLQELETVVGSMTESGRIICPACGPDRKHRNPTLSVTVNADHTLYACHHCGADGRINVKKAINYHQRLTKKVTPIPTQFNQDNELIKKFFAGRGVHITDMSVMPPMTTGVMGFNGSGKHPAIGFIYGPKDAPQAIKWRATDQKLFTSQGAAATFYGIERIAAGEKVVIVVEGEADVIALASIGVVAVSCPNGAPMKVSNGKVRPEDDKKYGYVWEAREVIEKAEKIILAVDGDQPGEALKEELARRIGRAKCWSITYPANCKDLTDVLREHGSEAVKTILDKSEAMPLVGVYSARSYLPELYDVYRNGRGRGESTGMAAVDELFTICGGQMTVVTGFPGSGKSELVDQIVVNLAMRASWKTAIASFENPPATHIAKLAEKILGKPYYAGLNPRMTTYELDSAVDFIDEHFLFLESRDGTLPTIDNVIDRCKQAIMRCGVRVLIIDPYNYIAHEDDIAEYKQIDNMLTKITAFAKAHDVHVFFVAHPQKLPKRPDGGYAIPRGMDISGSMAWWNKTDIGITVHRGDCGVEVHCWKVRFKHVGRVGVATLGYDAPTGRYFEPDDGRCMIAADKTEVKTTKPHWLDDLDLEF